MGKRGFVQEATVASTGNQNYEERFGKRPRSSDHEESPPIAHWRCNLTALSQKQNLYFIAYSANLYVYVPQYPTQELSQTPALIVPSQPSSPGLKGTVDPRHSHSINSLVVERLGNEEVVATVRDDGDVSLWLVRHIIHGIERRAAVGSTLSSLADEMKPIFQENVGQSAWGLAIHSEARILAVSANTHNITVFRFGLAQESANEDVSDEDASPQHREMDVTHSIINGSTNIPHIAFCNSGDDPSGRWLLTTDIGGNCRAMDLDAMQTNQTFRFGPVTSYLDSHDRFNSGWGIYFLDRRSFIPEGSMDAAVGLDRGELLPGLEGDTTVWDISGTVSNVPRCAARFSATKKNGRSSRERRSTSIASPGSSSQLEREAASSPVDASPSETNSTSVDDEHGDPDQELDEESDNSDASDDSVYIAEFDFDDEGTEDTTSFSNVYGGCRIYGNKPRAAYPQRSICEGLPCPILHASVRNVYLLQPPSELKKDKPFSPPTVGFTNALQQLVPGDHAWLNAFERLNMHVYIPAIGVVVLASQKGRAMVLTLTKLSKRTRSEGSQTENKSVYAMRIEHILPFDEQEEQTQRPFQPLHGIAASPIQHGSALLPEEQCRWRLMLMYADHSILSYEIRREKSRDSGIDVGSVLV